MRNLLPPPFPRYGLLTGKPGPGYQRQSQSVDLPSTPFLTFTTTCGGNRCYSLCACFANTEKPGNQPQSTASVGDRAHCRTCRTTAAMTTAASHHLSNCLPVHPPSFCRGGVRGAQDRVLLQAVWAVLHKRGDGEDKPLSQCSPLQELAGNHRPSLPVSEIPSPSTTWTVLILLSDLTPSGCSTCWLPPLCSQSICPHLGT